MSLRGRRLWAGAAAALMLAPAAVSRQNAWTPAVMAALTLAVAILARPSADRITLARAAGAACLLSLAADAAYSGKPGLALLWYPFETAALLVLLERVVRHVPGPRVAVAGVLTGAAALLLPLRFTLHDPAVGLRTSAFAVALTLFPVAVAAGVGLYLRSLDNRRSRAVAAARREQRLRVARDLHDFVAHEVTGIVLEAQAAQLGDGLGPDEHRALLARVEKAGLRALDSMDQMVAALREAEGRRWDEPPPTRRHRLADLPELLDRFASMTAAEVTLSLADDVTGALSQEADDTAYRVVLEALTNVRRHAPRAAGVAVPAARAADGSVEVTVADAGGPGKPAPAAGRHGGGTGLAGLGERVSALGGTLEAGPCGEGPGWRVRCRLPGPATH